MHSDPLFSPFSDLNPLSSGGAVKPTLSVTGSGTDCTLQLDQYYISGTMYLWFYTRVKVTLE